LPNDTQEARTYRLCIFIQLSNIEHQIET